MSSRLLRRLRRELEDLRRRRRSLRSSELAGLAMRLGRVRAKRGKEPTYERGGIGWFPLTIPDHPGTLAIGTACSILDQLEEDIERLEVELGASNARGEHAEEDADED